MLSLGQDPLWRRFLVSRLPADRGHVLDVATGTGLVAAELLRADSASPGSTRARRCSQSPAAGSDERRSSCTPPPRPSPFRTQRSTTSPSPICSATSTTRARRSLSSRASFAPAARVASLEFGVPRGPARPLWDLYVGVGLPLAGRALRNGWNEVGGFLGGSIREFWAALSPRAPARALAGSGAARPRSTTPEPRRRGRHLGAKGLRPSWYALDRGGWRDYVTLLHPPYTAWHLSYVVIGGCLAPAIAWGRLGAAVAAFALAVGVGAHALDELRGRPLAHDDSRHRPRRARRSLASGRPVRSGSSEPSPSAPGSRCWFRSALFLVVAYNLELAGGRFHSDLWFGLAWGGFPVICGYAAVAGET